MTKISLILVIFFYAFSQNNLNLYKETIEIAKLYKNFMFRNNPSEYNLSLFERIKSKELENTKSFIKEVITPNNNLESINFLALPDSLTLKYIYIVKRINWNLREKDPVDNLDLFNDLLKTEVSRYELVDNYYGILFASIGNKNKPFNFENTDFLLDNYNLKNDIENAIFFLKAMQLCGKSIWGYINIVKPPNYDKALSFIKKFPKFNGQAYYQFLDLNFKDFKIIIVKDDGESSYKGYYINKYYDLLINHLLCLNIKKELEEERRNLLLGSILKEENLYEYSKKKDFLETLFKRVE